MLMDQPELPSRRGNIHRRSFLGISSATIVAAAASGATAYSSDIPLPGAGPTSSDPGPENVPIRDASPNSFVPPTTDHGEVQTFWSTFSSAHRRIQEGGWSRQVTVADFPISKDIAGVNMRLTAGGVRELHWHQAAEWAIMLSGKARLTAIDYNG